MHIGMQLLLRMRVCLSNRILRIPPQQNSNIMLWVFLAASGLNPYNERGARPLCVPRSLPSSHHRNAPRRNNNINSSQNQIGASITLCNGFGMKGVMAATSHLTSKQRLRRLLDIAISICTWAPRKSCCRWCLLGPCLSSTCMHGHS